MILGSLIDLGVDAQKLTDGVSSLVDSPIRIDAVPFSDHGLHGTQVTVHVDDPAGHHPHRHLSAIRNIIQASQLSETVQARSIDVFQRLAEAEAAVHGCDIEKVHFHEVGAMDAIVDIVATCLALEILDVTALTFSPLPLGQGTTTSAHGVIPIPAPATTRLLTGFPVTQTDEPFELVTPTGAALLTTLQTTERMPATFELIAAGHGFGHRKLNKRPNLLRARYGRATVSTAAPDDTCIVLECNLDDTIPELLGSLVQRLISAGAHDAFTIPIQMKKQRPGTLLSVLAPPGEKDALIEIMFQETTTFGIREYPTTRTMLKRRHCTVQTPYGEVRVKLGERNGSVITRSPEHDDCVQRAEASNVSVRTVYEAAFRFAAESTDEP
jgi:uncharacterized protein (TIGR00299 family) protein